MSPEMAKAVELIENGATVAEAAAQAGVHSSGIYRYTKLGRKRGSYAERNAKSKKTRILIQDLPEGHIPSSGLKLIIGSHQEIAALLRNL